MSLMIERVELPVAVLLAGPNGAGKTTASPRLLGSAIPFLNADLIAADLRRSGHAAASVNVAAGRRLLADLATHVAIRQSFCIETNLAGRGWVHHINAWRDVGYRVTLQFLSLSMPIPLLQGLLNASLRAAILYPRR